jgi:hypothetical protein
MGLDCFQRKRDSEITDYSGMTVNERIFAAGIQGAWDQAVKNEDREMLTAIMKLVGLEDQATIIIEAEIGRWLYNKPKELRYQEIMKRQAEAQRR